MTRTPGSSKRREAVAFYLFISPWLIGFLVFLVYPLLSSLYYAFTHYDLGGTPAWIGIGNFAQMFADPRYWNSLKVTFVFALVSVPGLTVVALGLALVLSQRLRGVRAFRTIYFLPSVMSMVAISLAWFYVLRPETGPLAGVLKLFGIQAPPWVADESWALPTLILINVWLNFGGQMIIYMAGIKGIPPELYEVAEIDGAGRWARFRHVTLPMLSATIFLNLVLGIIGAMQVFDIPYVMTRGGPNDATRSYMIHLYNEGWIELQMGSASAMGWVLFLMILAVTLLVIRSSQAWVYYEGERR